MQSRGELRIDPGQLGTDAFSGELELVVPYTDPDLARALLRKVAALTAGLQARIALVAVHAVPFPRGFPLSRIRTRLPRGRAGAAVNQKRTARRRH
jgi:hypothetical protein